MKIKVRRGLDVGIGGAPRHVVRDGHQVFSVALQGEDYPGVRSLLRVMQGDRVKVGQTLFADRKREDIQFVSPGCGEVISIKYGRRRVLEALTIRLDGEDAVEFEIPNNLTRVSAQKLLLESGMWPSLITRPFGRIPDPGAVPAAIFVTAMDTNPLAADASLIITQNSKRFSTGLKLLEYLTDGLVYVCQAPGPLLAGDDAARLKSVQFSGRHPAGLPGTHINHLLPASISRPVWHIGYQDIIAIGHLISTGRILTERTIAVAGPGVKNPALVRTRLGAHLGDLLADELHQGDLRIVSGSLLSGRKASFLGRYHGQVSVLPEAWDIPKLPFLKRAINAAADAGPGPLIPISALERTMGLDILPVPLMRALSVGDVETAERLGCLELVEEDIALLTYVCASEVNYGLLLRDVLDKLEARG